MKETYVISNTELEYLKSSTEPPIWTDDLNKAIRYDVKPYIQLVDLNAKEEIAHITTVYTENISRSAIHQ